jgi:hypothetical protein
VVLKVSNPTATADVLAASAVDSLPVAGALSAADAVPGV